MLVEEEDELVNLNFKSNDTTVRVNNDNNKYTTIDNLTEDTVIEGQKYVLMSYVSPEGLMNCKIRGVKVRGVFNNMEEAKKKIRRIEKTR